MSKLLIDESPLIVLPSLAKAIGLQEAIVLQQIHYRLHVREADMREWVPCSLGTLVEWCPFLSYKAMKRIVTSLRDQGMIEVAQRGAFDRSNWLRVRYEAVNAISPNGPIDGPELGSSHGPEMGSSMGTESAHLYIQDTKSKKEEERERPRKRGSRRCPADFEVTPEMREWAARECPGVQVMAATAKFMDHEFASPKTDWLATWRNWLRKEPTNRSRPTRYEELMGRVASAPLDRPPNPLLIEGKL